MRDEREREMRAVYVVGRYLDTIQNTVIWRVYLYQYGFYYYYNTHNLYLKVIY
jgi:hypothetical protein